MAEMFLRHDNARPHTNLKTWEAIIKSGWTVLHHPPYSPDLAPSDFNLFVALKHAVGIVKFKTDGNVIAL
jgi:histone-lysine N-methyltransferase SETMAR